FVPKHSNFSPFCSAGHAQMADGRILIAGGDGDNVVNVFSFSLRQDGRFQIRTYSREAGFTDVSTLTTPRWYPTIATLPGGNFLIVGGSSLYRSYLPTDLARNNPTMEVFPPNGRGSVYLDILGETYPYNSYPIVQVLPVSGNVFIFAGVKSAVVDTSTLTVQSLLPDLVRANLEPSRSFPYLSPWTMLPLTYRNGKFANGLKLSASFASKSCSRIAPEEPNPHWLDEDMPIPRVMGDAVLLPDGTVLFVNGAKKGTADGPAGFSKAWDPSSEAVLFDPGAEGENRWKTMAAATVPRLYHSTALLLPDGRVLTAGSDQQNYANTSASPFEYRVEIFHPPFFSANRLVINSCPATVRYGEQFTVKVGNPLAVQMVSIVRYSTATHSTNPDQRWVELEIMQRSQGQGVVVASAPPNGKFAPPGAWMVFVLDSNKIPSVGCTMLLN
ncbi:hypothetical protein BJ742DRAFT_674944, partial [Cladochytrium replicatum]